MNLHLLVTFIQMLPYLEITHSQDLSGWAGEERSKSNMAESKDITEIVVVASLNQPTQPI